MIKHMWLRDERAACRPDVPIDDSEITYKWREVTCADCKKTNCYAFERIQTSAPEIDDEK